MLTMFLEGLKALIQPCSAILLVSGLAVILAAQKTGVFAFLGYIGGVALTRWLIAADYIAVPDSNILLGITFLAGIALVWVDAKDQNWAYTAVGGLVVAAVAAVIWQPCRNGYLDTVVAQTSGDPIGGLRNLTAYFAGLCGILILFVILPFVFTGWRSNRDRMSTGLIGITIGTALAVFTAIGDVPDLSQRFFEMSSGA